jgi:hypothetical protein
MNQNGSNSGRPFNQDDLFPDFRAPIAPEVVAKPVFPKFPSFPTVAELLDQEHPHPLARLTSELPKRPPSYGLLQELLGGRLDVLISDAQRHPERYDVDTRELLELLGSNPAAFQKMNPTEQQMLNRAVIDYAAFKPREKPPIPPKAQKAKPVNVEEPEPPVEEEGPGNVLSNYWWLT